jgi:hypothetical protein
LVNNVDRITDEKAEKQILQYKLKGPRDWVRYGKKNGGVYEVVNRRMTRHAERW